MNKTDILERLVVAIENGQYNIAPNYQEFLDIAFALVDELGEEGRSYFHRICRPSPKYKLDEADKQYDECLRSSQHKHSLGTIIHYAQLVGVKLPSEVKDYSNNNLSFTPTPSLAHTPVPYNMAQATECDENGSLTDLPTFPRYDWPVSIMRCLDICDTDAKRDIVFLGTTATLGATLGRFTSTFYSRKKYYPSIELFIGAKSTSGKGELSHCFQLAKPFHDEMRDVYKREMEQYRLEKSAWDCMGKERKNHPEPEEPQQKVFFVSANNSSTGVQEQLCNNGGIGLIADTEADTLSTALNADYGQWSQLLRKAFDHDDFAYNRRKDHEYKECEEPAFGVILSGTFGQLVKFIPSVENGLFPRQVFYALPSLSEWADQFDDESPECKELFLSYGRRWKEVLDMVKAQVGHVFFHLSKEQQQKFNETHAQLFSHATVTMDGELRSQVARMAINILRLMNIVALVRSLDSWLTADTFEGCTLDDILALPGIAPSKRNLQENTSDGIVSSLDLTISDDDFSAVLSLANILYRHASHMLQYVGDAHVEMRKISPLDNLLATLPNEFTRKELVAKATEKNIPESTVDTFLRRATKDGKLENPSRSVYRFKSSFVSSRACVREDTPERLKERKEDEA